jgi:hypothetical protein
MSAFICKHTHITALAVYAAIFELTSGAALIDDAPP